MVILNLIMALLFFFFFNIVGQFLKNSCIFQCNLEKKK